MIISDERIKTLPILSLHVTGKVANITDLIIDPHTLKVIAYRVDGPTVGGDIGDILLIDNARETSPLGIVIDSTDEFVSAGDVIRVKDALQLNFSLIGLKVITKKKSNLGRVTGYNFDPQTGEILQLVVRRPVFKAFIDPELIIARSEIVEVDDQKVIVRGEESSIRKSAQENFVPNFINPFRKAPE